MNRVSRRQLLKYGITGVAGAIAAPYFIPSGVLAVDGKPGANERITLGVIGVGRRARQLIDQLPEQGKIAAVADCFVTRCTTPYRYVNRDAAQGKKPNWRIHQDYRKLLDEKDIDAVIVATPDHNRVLACIRACQAGKDIYAEKPLTLYIHEGRLLVQAVRKYGRILQVGTQQRSMEINRFACEFVRQGGIGKIRQVRAINFASPILIPAMPKEPIPERVRLGPVAGPSGVSTLHEPASYSLDDVVRLFRRRSDQQGAHAFDQVQSALGMDETGPVEFWPAAGRFGHRGAADGTARCRTATPTESRWTWNWRPSTGRTAARSSSGEKGKIEINRNKFTTNPKDS